MHLEWLLNPLTFYSVATVGLIAIGLLFVSIKLEIAKSGARTAALEAGREADQLSIRALATELEKVRASISELEMAKPVLVPRSVGQGLNLTKRAQALRMHRRGETLPSIAAALETPINEIALILKVQMITIDQQQKAS